MYDYVDLGPAPAFEETSDAPNQPELNKAECRIYRAQLLRTNPVPAGLDAWYIIKTNDHDFGPYREVGIRFNEQDAAASTWAWEMQDNSPTHWDAQAKVELAAWKQAHLESEGGPA
jgi:hypothetical protein